MKTTKLLLFVCMMTTVLHATKDRYPKRNDSPFPIPYVTTYNNETFSEKIKKYPFMIKYLTKKSIKDVTGRGVWWAIWAIIEKRILKKLILKLSEIWKNDKEKKKTIHDELMDSFKRQGFPLHENQKYGKWLFHKYIYKPAK